MELVQKIRKRGGIKHKISNFATFLNKFKDNVAPSDSLLEQLASRVTEFVGILSEFEKLQDEIEYSCTEEELTTHYQYRDQVINDYHLHLAAARLILKQFQPQKSDNAADNSLSVNSNNQSQNNINVTNNVRLPIIDLPKFTGNYTMWLEFKDTFESLIHKNESIDDVQKYHYLKASLEPEPLKVIQALEFSSQNYTVAWDLLCKRYNNSQLLIHNHLKSLFEITSLTKESAMGLRNIVDTVSEHLRALETLKQPTQHWDMLIIFLISTKLDKFTMREWESYKLKHSSLKLDDFHEFLRSRANFLEALEGKHDTNTKDKQHKRISLISANTTCNYCKKPHTIYTCEEFLKLSAIERGQNVRKLNLCENCLWSGHRSNKCRSSNCKKCHKKHNTLLHRDHLNSNDTSNPTDQATTSNQVSLASNTTSSQVLLSTVVISSYNSDGSKVLIRALLDSGSQSHFISEDLANKLNLNSTPINASITGLNSVTSNIKSTCSMKLQSNNGKFTTTIQAYVIPTITSDLPSQFIDTSSWKIPENLPLADPDFNVPNRIDLLIGASLFWTILSNRVISLGKDLPVLWHTHLGWIVTGNCNQPLVANSSICNFAKTQSLHDNLQLFWEVEELSEHGTDSIDDLECERHFCENTYRDSSGRFVVKIPLKHPLELLGNSKDKAVKSLLSLERQFNKQASLKQSYCEFMKDYQLLGHMSSDNTPNDSDLSYFLPHHGVMRSESLTTKLRVVFNGSSPTTSGWSLNDLQYTGSSIINDLFSILLRFRQYTIAVSADVAKMYRQILVNPSDRRLQLILWRESPSEAIQTFQLNTVTYGTRSAPFLAMRCLSELAKINEDSFPIASSIIDRDIYVDDLITGFNLEQDAIQTCTEITAILGSAHFPLRKWHSNNSSILEHFKNDTDPTSVIPIGSKESIKTLGVFWNSSQDIFTYQFTSTLSDEEITKRNILSIISRIFDPLGLISSCVIIAKILIQKLWVAKIEWDEPIPSELQLKWRQFYDQLHCLNQLSIPRHAILNNSVEIQLHGFCDASQVAYAACIYLRCIDSSHTICTNLLCAKTKVAPLKVLTTPRLELCGALLLTRLCKKVLSSLSIKTTTFLWSDSQIVLAWLRTEPKRLQPFVGNRISEIQASTGVNQWRYVPSKENPADLASRGVLPNVLLNSQLWWFGPHWLSLPSEDWPVSSSSITDTAIPELKGQGISLISVTQDFPIFDRYSSYLKLKQVIAYCLRFTSNCLLPRDERVFTHLTISELDKANKVLIRLAQSQDFANEIKCLQTGLHVKGSLAKLSPFLDSDQLLRVGGRLKHSDLPMAAKHPYLLKGSHPLVRLIMKYEHERLLHAGPQLLLSHIKQNYWPTSGIQFAKQVVRTCVKCFRFKPLTSVPLMGNLPKERVTISPPFNNTGVDFAGPIYLKQQKGRGARVFKAYICLFICLASKATHIELVTELSTACFIAAFRRFIARRGTPANVFSDNGTNFVGASNELKSLSNFIRDSKSKISDVCTRNSIKWHFIPPKSPHFGGLWEANIKSIKKHLFTTIGDAKLTYEEMITLLVQIEGILNSRPLHPMSQDPHDLEPLTPFHFLIGRHYTALPEPSADAPAAVNRLQRFQLLQQILRSFWKRWSRDYLSHLQQKSKWSNNSPNLRVGAMVLLKQDHLPPYQWPLGRIISLHPGSDNCVRVVTVKTLTGVYKRGVVNVFQLPDPETEDDIPN